MQSHSTSINANMVQVCSDYDVRWMDKAAKIPALTSLQYNLV